MTTGCGRRPGVRPGTTGLLRVAVPPSAAAGARQRVFWLRVPAGYDPGRPVPLVLAFHGGGGTGLGMQRVSRLSVLADRRGFLAAYPQGLVQADGKGPAGWDASGPADPYADGIDDGLFVSDLLNAVQAGYCVNPREIAATGLSNGAGLTGYLACVLADRIAAFVPVEECSSGSRAAVTQPALPRSWTCTCAVIRSRPTRGFPPAAHPTTTRSRSRRGCGRGRGVTGAGPPLA